VGREDTAVSLNAGAELTDQDFVGSLYETTGISVNVESPLWVANRGYFASFTEELDTYTHEIDVAVGFKSAQIKLRLGRQAAEQWLLEGLGRPYEVIFVDKSMPGKVEARCLAAQ